MQPYTEMTPEEYPIIAMECHTKMPRALFIQDESMAEDSQAEPSAALGAPESQQQQQQQQQQHPPEDDLHTSSKDTSESLYGVSETFTVWPPDCTVVPGNYDTDAANAGVFRKRAQRVMHLGNYWATQGQSSRCTDSEDSAMCAETLQKGAVGEPCAVDNTAEKESELRLQAAAKALASKAGGFSELAKLGRELLQRDDSGSDIVRRNSSAQSCF